MKKVQVRGVHHITLVGSTKQSAIDFWPGALGMPFVLEQPKLGKPDENHLYFDPGDGRLLTVFTNEKREDTGRPAPQRIDDDPALGFGFGVFPFKDDFGAFVLKFGKQVEHQGV